MQIFIHETGKECFDRKLAATLAEGCRVVPGTYVFTYSTIPAGYTEDGYHHQCQLETFFIVLETS